MEIHIVVKGDTLWKIARQYGIPFEELKRANAHLAKSEYIVPGMKIFLPNKVHGGKQEHVKHPETGKAPVKPTHPPAPPVQHKPTQPTHPAPPVHQKPTQPAHPKPIPPVQHKPTQPTHPKPIPPAPRPPAPTPIPPVPKPPIQVAPPLPLPTPSLPMPPTPIPVPPPVPVPTPPPIQMFPMQPCQPCMHHHPMIGIPCGWMPIFDADCHPFMHSGQIQAMPQLPATQQPAPLPLPTPSLPSTQFPMYEEECEESPIFSSQGPAVLPQQVPMVEGWQLIESPDNLCEESPEWDSQPSAWCPPEQGYIPQLAPAMQQSFPMMPFPTAHQGCGCGCDGRHHHQMMMMPLFYGHPCNCQSSMQPTPYPMMPTAQQGSNWYGSY